MAFFLLGNILAGVGCSAGKWSLTKTGVFGSQCWRQDVIKKNQSPEQWQQRSYWDMTGLSRISGVTETRNMFKKKNVCVGRK